MKIAIVTWNGVDPSGIHHVVPCFLALIERLTRGGDELHVFRLYRGQSPEPWSFLGATIHSTYAIHPTWRLFRQIIAEHRRAPIDVIHTLWSPRAIFAAVAAAKMLRVPVLVYFGAGELAAIPDVRYGKQRTLVGRLWLRVIAAAADRVGAQSDCLVNQARGRNIAAERMSLGVAQDRWPVKPPRRRVTNVNARLLHVANVLPFKDHEMLLEVAVELHALGIAFELDMIGMDIPADGLLQRRIAALGLADRIRFHGFIPHHATRPYFETADLLVVTSRYEAGPLVVYEAAMAGVPAVGTNVGHLSEMAPAAARVVEPRDSSGLARVIAHLLSNEEERLSLAVRAQQIALVQDADATTWRFREVYAEMAAGRGRNSATRHLLEHPG